MKCFDKRYLTIDKLRDTSKHLIRIRLAEFLKTFNIKEYPINCITLLDDIIKSGMIKLEIRENNQLHNSFDAAAIYSYEKDSYCILLNSSKKGSFIYSRYRRFNFTIAHEIGHIVLEHLLIPHKYKTKNELEYEDLEADEFAGRLLVPEKLLLNSNFVSREEVAKEFLVSDQAIYKRVNNLKRLDLFNSTPVATCKTCGNKNISPIAEFCIICRTELTTPNKRGVRQIDYSPTIKMDGSSRFIFCPICKNEEISNDAFFCRICGNSLCNECTGNNYSVNCCHRNPSNARYCEICGRETLYSESNLLMAWKEERQDYIVNSTHR